MKILFFTRYGRLGASSRVRAMQFFAEFERMGWRCDVSPLLSDNYVRALYGKKRRERFAIIGVLRRLAVVFLAGRYDLIWIEKELFPFCPAWVEQLLHLFGVSYVVDYDDATFHRYDVHERWLVRLALGHKIDVVMRGARLVTAGNEYLASRAIRAGSKKVEVVPTVIDSNRYRVSSRSAGPTVLGWIGSPATTDHLSLIAVVLARLQHRCGVTVRLIGSGPIELPGVSAQILPWSEAEEVGLVASCDIGMMPLPDRPWERGKCGYKLVQFMACGIPVVASPVGFNTDIVRHGENGFLASTADQWESALLELIENVPLRERMGKAGRRLVETTYSIRTQAPRLKRMFLEAMSP